MSVLLSPSKSMTATRQTLSREAGVCLLFKTSWFRISARTGHILSFSTKIPE